MKEKMKQKNDLKKCNQSCNELKKHANYAGITLIALVITIIIIVILGGVTLSFILSENGILGVTQEAKFKTKMAEIAEEFELYKAGEVMDNYQTIDLKQMYAGEVLKSIIVDEELDIEESVVQDIKSLLTKVGKEEEKYVIIHEGELYYVSQSKIPNNAKQTEWCEEIGIKIWEYEGSTGSKVVNGNYEYVHDVWVCTPMLNTGFVKTNTRYIKEENGNLVPRNWINKKPDDDWYDYNNQKWPNIYVESSGIESYYVWIPRYAYKLNNEQQRTDIIFIDVDNSYKEGEDGTKTEWAELEAQGYQVPEAFYWGDNDDQTQNTPIPGYWMSKYQLSDLLGEYTIDFSTVATTTSITIKDIKTNVPEGKEVARYNYAVNGKILYTSTSPDEYTITDLAKGDKAVNVTALDENGNIIGSMTKLYATADVNEPDLTGFDKDTTFYVYWDSEGNEHNETPISMPAPDEWYDYGIRNWANIVTRNNGLESYYVWIPRYAYQLDNVSQRTYVKFIKGTSTEVDAGYQIPEAFTWGDNADPTQNVQLTGYWISKYQLSEVESTPRINAEFSASGNSIKVNDITGTLITEGLTYEYYLNGVSKHTGTSATENYEFKGLENNKTYTVNIIARNTETNAYVGAVTKKVQTIAPNAPDLTGFNKEQTYYVTFDKEGNPVIGNNINGAAPENWYDYTNRNWANIVVTDGTVTEGRIENGSYQNYFVWIPRYAYRLDTVNQRTDIKFLNGTSTEVETGYEIPEAFTWGDNQENTVQLKGYWISKYQLSNS